MSPAEGDQPSERPMRRPDQEAGLASSFWGLKKGLADMRTKAVLVEDAMIWVIIHTGVVGTPAVPV